MALFRRKKKESEQDTAETEAVSPEAAGEEGDGDRPTVVRSTVDEPAGGGSFIPETETAGPSAPPPAPGARVDPPAEEPAATVTAAPPEEAEAEEAEEPEPEPEPEPSAAAPPAEEPEPAAAAAPPEPVAAPSPGPTTDAGRSPLAAHEAVEHDPFEQRPEVFVGAAFAGGFLFAQLLKWMAGDDE